MHMEQSVAGNGAQRAHAETPHSLPKYKLSTRLSLLTALLCLLSFLAVGLISLNGFRAKLKETLIDQQDTLMESVASGLDQKMLLLQRGLVLTAKQVKPWDLANSDSAQRFLDSQTGLHAMFDRSVFLFSPEGQLVAEYPYRLARRGQDFSFRSYIRETVRTRSPQISEPFTTTKDDRATVLMFTAPVFDANGKLIAILTGSLGLSKPDILDNLSKAQVGTTGFLYLVNAEGMLILHPDTNRLSRRAYAPGAFKLFDSALEGYQGTAEVKEPGGIEVLASFRRIPSVGWTLAARYPVAEAFSPFTDVVFAFVGLLTASCALTLAGCLWITRRELKPLELLTEQMRASSAAGGQVAEIHLHASGEIGELGTAFNDLVRRLRARECSVHETTRRFQLISQHSTNLVTTMRPDGCITYVSPVSSSFLGVPPEEMIERCILDYVHPKDRRLVKHTIEETRDDGAIKVIAYRMRREDETYVCVETTLRLMTSEDGGSSEVLCISRNVADPVIEPALQLVH